MILNEHIGIAGYYSKENNFMYVPILKNAHMWGEHFLSHNFGCTEYTLIVKENIKLFKDTIFMVILRDPIDRWISAITQYLIVGFEDPCALLDNTEIKKIITDGVMFDNHATPQFFSLKGIDEKKAVFFICDEHLEKNISDFSVFCFGVPTKPVGPARDYNVSAYNDTKQFLYPKVKNMVYQDEEIMNKLKRFYNMDFDLIERLKIKDFSVCGGKKYVTRY